MTPYVRFGLLFYALDHAGLLGLQTLDHASKGERALDGGHAFFRCALDDSMVFIAGGDAPDTCLLLSCGVRC